MRVLALFTLATFTAASWGQARPVPFGSPQNEAPKVRAAEGAKSDKKARQLVQAFMGRRPIVNVRAVIIQRLDYTSNVMQHIKVEMSKAGKVHQVVFAPLQYAGRELVDDGINTRTYSPDDRSMIEQPSPKQEPNDLSFRMNLVDKNYILRIDRKEKIAGRDAVVIQAVPRSDGLETRCYSVDEKTGFLLRLETCKEGRAPMLHFEAKMVEFPSEFAGGTFKLEGSLGVVTHRFDHRCVSPEAASQLTPLLRFKPIVPTNLPYGFAVQELQAETDSDLPAVAIRVTDGLAKATVLQWKRSGSSEGRAPDGTRVKRTGQMTLLISGDLPDSVKEKILDAFVRTARGEKALDMPIIALSRALELRCNTNVFPFDSETQGLAPIIFALPDLFRI